MRFSIKPFGRVPPVTRMWTELPSVRAYYAFFKENEWRFES